VVLGISWEASIAKPIAADRAVGVVDRCLQFFGG
jgi:alkylation response protein AidB-like acyl-CoA dehydrogenase